MFQTEWTSLGCIQEINNTHTQFLSSI